MHKLLTICAKPEQHAIWACAQDNTLHLFRTMQMPLNGKLIRIGIDHSALNNWMHLINAILVQRPDSKNIFFYYFVWWVAVYGEPFEQQDGQKSVPGFRERAYFAV